MPATTNSDRGLAFPIGASLTLGAVKRALYPAYRRLREAEPVSWVPALGMWLVTRYDDAQTILMDLRPTLEASPRTWFDSFERALSNFTHDPAIEAEANRAVAAVRKAIDSAPTIFPDPERFDLARPNAKKHLGFAIGPHSCIGLHLAKLEVRIALETLMRRLPGLKQVSSAHSSPEGNELRQPRRMDVAWPS